MLSVLCYSCYIILAVMLKNQMLSKILPSDFYGIEFQVTFGLLGILFCKREVYWAI